MIRNHIILILSLSLISIVKAQDFQFSQPFSSSIYLNPAFTGNGILVCTEIKEWKELANFKGTAQFRTQWNGKFQSSLAAIEHSRQKSNWSFGVYFINDVLNPIHLTNNYTAICASVNVAKDPDWIVKFGYQLGFGNRFLSQKNFDFADEFNGTGFNTSTTAENPFTGISKFYIDLASIGILIQHKSLFLGASGYHLSQPNNSLWNGEDVLKRKLAIQGGVVLDFKTARSTRQSLPSGYRLYLVSTFKNQAGSQQWDGGSYIEYATPVGDQYYLLHLGGWYRGIPLRKAPDKFAQNDAFVAIFGIQRNMIRLLYSYDVPLSNALNFGISHEISILAQITSHKCRRDRPFGAIPCNAKTKYKGRSRTIWRN